MPPVFHQPSTRPRNIAPHHSCSPTVHAHAPPAVSRRRLAQGPAVASRQLSAASSTTPRVRKQLQVPTSTGIRPLRNKCSPPVSKKLGCCLECFDGTPVDPSSYLAPSAPAAHRPRSANPSQPHRPGRGHTRAAAHRQRAGRPLPHPFEIRRTPAFPETPSPLSAWPSSAPCWPPSASCTPCAATGCKGRRLRRGSGCTARTWSTPTARPPARTPPARP